MTAYAIFAYKIIAYEIMTYAVFSRPRLVLVEREAAKSPFRRFARGNVNK